jgi:hypothetical protein
MKRARKASEPGNIDRIDGIVCSCVLVEAGLGRRSRGKQGLGRKGRECGSSGNDARTW